MTAYTVIKFVHVVLAIPAVGANITYAVWLQRAAREPRHLDFALKGVKALDDRIANPAYGFLLITGLALLVLGRVRWTTPWVLSAIALYVIVVGLALFRYTPLLSRQIATLGRSGAQSAEFQALAAQNRTVGILLAVLVLLIVFLMVTKPSLWG